MVKAITETGLINILLTIFLIIPLTLKIIEILITIKDKVIIDSTTIIKVINTTIIIRIKIIQIIKPC